MCDEVEMIKVVAGHKNMIAIRPEILVLHKIHCSLTLHWRLQGDKYYACPEQAAVSLAEIQ